jgi:hypothetical protein
VPHDMNDHDLLITIYTQLQRALMDIAALDTKLNTDRLSKTESDRIVIESEKIHVDHERRLRRVETYGSYAVGIIGFINIITIIGLFAIKLFKH